MKWLKRHWRGICRMISALLLCAGAFFAYWWCYKLAPARHTSDPRWYSSHSQQEIWLEVQKGIRRGVWLHDDGFTVGEYGDKSWAEWIMAHVEPGTEMSCMSVLCHSATAMRHITNQDVGDSADAWLAWWADNKAKTQEEWIADGFRHRGFEVDVPPSEGQTPVLLEILGKSAANQQSVIPDELKYNAFRCLRDSGFEPVAFALSNRNVSGDVELGLREYAEMERSWPSSRHLGILPFGQDKDDAVSWGLPRMLEPDFQITADFLAFGLPLLGVALLLYSFGKQKRQKPSYSDQPQQLLGPQQSGVAPGDVSRTAVSRRSAGA